MKNIVFLLILYCAGFSASGQLLPYHRYTSKDGLIADRITVIQQDEQGVMWFGSYFGLGNYDGISFQKIPLPFEQRNKYVTSILPFKRKIYAGFLFGGGLAEFSNGQVKAYSLLNIDPRTSNDVIAICRFDNSSILVANGRNEIYQFRNGKFTRLYSLSDDLPSYAIQQLLMDEKNQLWISTNDGLFIIPPSGEKGKLSFFRKSGIISLALSSNGKMQMAMTDGAVGSVFQCDGLSGNALLNLSKMADIPGLIPSRFTGNPGRGFWVLDSQRGVLNITGTNKVVHYPIAVDLNSDIKTLFVDREKNLWIANDPGLTKVSNFSSVSWNFDQSAAGGGFILKAVDGVMWGTNSKDLYRIEQDSMQKVEFRGKAGGYIGKMLLDSLQNLWMARWDEGIWKTTWKGNKLIDTKYFNALLDEKVSGGAFNIARDGNIWLAGGNGIFRIRNDVVRERYRPVDEAGNFLFINVIVIDPRENVLWMGDNALGVVKMRYRIEKGDHYILSIEKIFGPEQGLKDPYVRSMLLDKQGDLWIGTRAGGVYRLHTSGNDEKVEAFGVSPIINCSRITAIAEEKNEAIWFASCDGIYRFIHNSKEWQHFNVSDGILSAEVFHMAVDADKQKVWVVTELGITRIDYAYPNEKPVAPLVHIKEVNVLGKPDTTALDKEGVSKYEYAFNSIGFVFAGSSFLNEKKIVYKYRLEGYDQKWSEPVTTNTVNYASLAPGRYTFKVMAANSRGMWSESPATFTFQIILPFYRSPWFIFACIAIAVSLFYLVRVDRLKQKYRVEKIRMRIARDLHDDIGSALGSINLMSETGNRRLEKITGSAEVSGVFTRIGHSAQSTLESMDDIIWSINPDKDKLGDLVVRMREFAIPLLEARDIAFDFKVNAADYKKLPMHLRKNVFLIFKEAMFNIIKHSSCTRVLIVAEIRNNVFCLRVKDNGRGFDANQPTQRNGLKNMRKRCEMVGGTLHMETQPRKGTAIEFSCVIK